MGCKGSVRVCTRAAGGSQRRTRVSAREWEGGRERANEGEMCKLSNKERVGPSSTRRAVW